MICGVGARYPGVAFDPTSQRNVTSHQKNYPWIMTTERKDQRDERDDELHDEEHPEQRAVKAILHLVDAPGFFRDVAIPDDQVLTKEGVNPEDGKP